MYKWTAIYSDNKELCQYEGKKENLFKDIDEEKLIAFRIDKEKQHIIVDLNIGIFMLNGNIIEIPDISYKNDNYRLIYFRRVRVSIASGGIGETGRTTESFIGFQVTTDDKNYKFMISELDGKYKFHFK